jgi:hypothetical protein
MAKRPETSSPPPAKSPGAESLGEADIGIQGNAFPSKRICVEIQVWIGPCLEQPFPIDLLKFIDEETEIVVVALSRTALCGTQTYLS